MIETNLNILFCAGLVFVEDIFQIKSQKRGQLRLSRCAHNISIRLSYESGLYIQFSFAMFAVNKFANRYALTDRFSFDLGSLCWN